ncbi:hypothetical protein LUZ60_017723 [Juncus effusus]|nr:hypothetical protein LUZ60_017723 [Juncus effusus]
MSSSILPIAGLLAVSAIFVLIQLYITYCASERNADAEREEAIEASELAAQQHQETKRGLSLGDVAKLPCYEFNANRMIEGKIAGKEASPICPVCLETFRPGEKYRVLPSCGHAFHVNCVDLWLVKNATCPICRADVTLVVRPEEHVVIDISTTQDS